MILFVLFGTFTFAGHTFSAFLRRVRCYVVIENLLLFQLFEKRLQLLVDVGHVQLNVVDVVEQTRHARFQLIVGDHGRSGEILKQLDGQLLSSE